MCPDCGVVWKLFSYPKFLGFVGCYMELGRNFSPSCCYDFQRSGGGAGRMGFVCLLVLEGLVILFAFFQMYWLF